MDDLPDIQRPVRAGSKRNVRQAESLRLLVGHFVDQTSKSYDEFKRLMEPYSAELPAVGIPKGGERYNELAWFHDYFGNVSGVLRNIKTSSSIPESRIEPLIRRQAVVLQSGRDQFSHMLQMYETLCNQHKEEGDIGFNSTNLRMATEHLRVLKSQTDAFLDNTLLKAALDPSTCASR